MLSIVEFKKVTGIHVTVNHSGKMEGASSLSTSPLCNPLCDARRRRNKAFWICPNCYSETLNRLRPQLAECLKKNTEKLTYKVLAFDEMPILGSKSNCFRFEAFGDLMTDYQAMNYLRMVIANPTVDFGWWTKNPEFIKRAFKELGVKKPKNLSLVGSSQQLNKVDESFFTDYDFFDYVFTVYDKEYAEKNNIRINCGSKSCEDCGWKCYRKTHNTRYINELKK